MSGRPPDDPFGRNDRTVLRPNPGGRLPATPAPAAPSYPSPPPRPATPAGTEDWMLPPEPPPPPPRREQQPGIVERAPADAGSGTVEAPNPNPIMKAAGPLLVLLGRLRVDMLRAPFQRLMEQVAPGVETFEREIRTAGVPAAQAEAAKYILCATADDIVQHIPREDRQVWTQYSMLSRFFGERIGGVRFFEELDRAKQDPATNYDLLELMHACLALGFQGKYRMGAGGLAELQQVQRNLYETLRRVKPRAGLQLSPRWQGRQLAARTSRVVVPVWVVASVFGVALLGLFLALRALLGGPAEAAADGAVTLQSRDRIALERKVFAPPPPPPPVEPNRITQLQRIRTALAPEIQAGTVSVDPSPNAIVVRVPSVAMFDSGDADVKEGFLSHAARIGQMLEKEWGWVRIVGHSDSTPVNTTRFASNWDLSLARAKAVANLLKPAISKPQRIQVDGKGADSPIASNSTPDGRARNRRVEILIERTD